MYKSIENYPLIVLLGEYAIGIPGLKIEDPFGKTIDEKVEAYTNILKLTKQAMEK